MLEALPAMRAAQEGAGECRRDGAGDPAPLFSPLPRPEVLEEGKGELTEERVVVQPAPGTPLEVAQPQLALHLLVHLLAYPPRLDHGGQGLERGVGRQVRE